MDDYLEIAGKRFASRLIVGTGKYGSMEEMVRAIERLDLLARGG